MENLCSFIKIYKQMRRELNLPGFTSRIRQTEKGDMIFDPVRKKYIYLTPEEWVRQHIINYLVNNLGYPIGLLNVEKKVDVNGQPQRIDLLANSKKGKPILLVECKAPEVKITQQAFDQINVYNQFLKVPFLLVTNGLQHFCFKLDEDHSSYVFLEEIPSYMAIVK